MLLKNPSWSELSGSANAGMVKNGTVIIALSASAMVAYRGMKLIGIPCLHG
jgi:hypothetical protein